VLDVIIGCSIMKKPTMLIPKRTGVLFPGRTGVLFPRRTEVLIPRRTGVFDICDEANFLFMISSSDRTPGKFCGLCDVTVLESCLSSAQYVFDVKQSFTWAWFLIRCADA
jgi:hypothetical protein